MKFQNTKTAAIGLFLGTLLLGVFIGVLVDRALLLQPAPPFDARRHKGLPEGHGFFMQHFAHELDLTAQQQAQLDSILAGNRQRFDALRRSVHPRFSALRDSLDRQILALLTPPQREKFAALKKERIHPWREARKKKEEP